MIHIIDNYYVEANGFDYQAIVKYKGKDKEGNEKETIKVLGYYRNLADSIKAIVRDRFSKGLVDKDLELEDALKLIKEYQEELEKLIDEVTKDF